MIWQSFEVAVSWKQSVKDILGKIGAYSRLAKLAILHYNRLGAQRNQRAYLSDSVPEYSPPTKGPSCVHDDSFRFYSQLDYTHI